MAKHVDTAAIGGMIQGAGKSQRQEATLTDLAIKTAEAGRSSSRKKAKPEKPNKSTKLTIRITDETKERLDEIAIETDRSLSSLIGQFIARGIEEHDAKK